MHLSNLYETLKEQNFIRLTESLSRVETTHVIEPITLKLSDVKSKLLQMILYKKLNGILYQRDEQIQVNAFNIYLRKLSIGMENDI